MSNLFHSDSFLVDLSENPAAKGHLTILNFKPMIDCNDKELFVFFMGVSQCATALFELLGAHGTNIIIQEKDDSLSGDIISRMPNDGLDFLWQPTKADPVQIDEIAKSIKDEIDILVWEKDNPGKDSSSGSSSSTTTISQETSADGTPKINYLFKKLHRTP